MIALRSPALRATVSPLGSELQSLTDSEGHDWLWDGDPAWWTGRAPILFPVVGVVAGGVIHVDGTAYPLDKHGFARRRAFEVVHADDATALLRLDADAATRAAYPFDFALETRFTLRDATLEIVATVENRGDRPMPASFGYHPAFRWPLPQAGGREDHVVGFAEPEPAPIRRIDADGLLTPDRHPTPVAGDMLRPRDAMFADDALIFDTPASRSLWFGVPGRPGVRLDYPELPLLGIWTKPGAPYLCLEPWQGIADPVGFTGDLSEKPGVVILDPGATRCFTLRITIGADEPDQQGT